MKQVRGSLRLATSPTDESAVLKRRFPRYSWWLLGFAPIVLLAVFAVIAGEDLSAPVPRTVGAPPPSLEAHHVEFQSRSGSVIHGWLCEGTPNRGAILLLHGVRGDRRDMISRAEFLHRAGYSVLMIDFQSHGESAGDRITFGYLESRDALAAVNFLKTKFPEDRIGVIGVSLGAASFVLADPRPVVSAAVLESMYPTIDQALSDRLQFHLGRFGPLLAPVLRIQLKPRLGITAEQLRPIDRIAKIGSPVLIVAGTDDKHTTVQETQAIFGAALRPKEIWLVQGAAHVDLHLFAREEYERRILQYFGTYLRPTEI